MKTNLPLRALLAIVVASVGVLASCADEGEDLGCVSPADVFPISSALDAGRGQVGCLQFVEGDEGPELTRLWVVDQTTLNLATLIGPEDARVLVTTDAPGALMALGSGVDEYDEFVVWRSAETGEELTRSDALPAMGIGLSVNPGFSGTILYPAADGTLYELSPRGVDPVCPTG